MAARRFDTSCRRTIPLTFLSVALVRFLFLQNNRVTGDNVLVLFFNLCIYKDIFYELFKITLGNV